MDIVHFIRELRLRHIQLSVEDSNLAISAPKGTVDTQLVEILRVRKRELMEFLRTTAAPPLSPLRRVRRTATLALPLSNIQNQWWFIYQLNPTSPAWVNTSCLRFLGQLCVSTVDQGITEILRRHEVLRTTYPHRDGLPFQQVGPAPDFIAAMVDLSALPDSAQALQVERLAAEQAVRPIDLVLGPLLRLDLIRQNNETHACLFSIHHIAIDAWSFAIVVKEIASLHDDFSDGKSSILRELPVQYGDYATWQHGWRGGAAHERDLAYWTETLRDCPRLGLPMIRPRPGLGRPSVVCDPRLLARSVAPLLKLSTQQGTTLFTLLLSAFSAVLAGYAGQDDVVVGTVMANRDRLDLEGVVGFFVDTIALRTDLSGDPDLAELMRRAHRSYLDALSHRHVAFQQVVRTVSRGRPEDARLFDALFVLQNAPAERLDLRGVVIEAMPVRRAMDSEDREIAISVWESDGQLFAVWEYRSDLYDGAMINRLFTDFSALLESVVQDPGQRLSALALSSTTAAAPGYEEGIL